MKRTRLIALLLVAAPWPPLFADCSGRADIRDIPVIELAAKKSSDRFAVMVTGDGGWRKIDARVTDKLRAEGIPIVGFIASDYFRTRRTPDESGCALERVIRTYKVRWHKEHVILIGYSRGADALPFMTSRLAPEVRKSVQLVALLGLEPWIDFKYNPPWSLAHYFGHEDQFAVLPEVQKLRGDNVVCVYGEKEKDSLCRQLDAAQFKIVREPGGHHFAGRYRDVSDVILIESAAAARSN